MNYFEDPFVDKEYKYKFLVYPNITKLDDLEKDSYVDVMRNVISTLNSSVTDQVFWSIISPKQINSLQFDNTDQLIYELPSYPNLMRTHFDSRDILKSIDWKSNDYDVVYSHLPEQTDSIANVMYNSTDMAPKIIGYCHWYEIEENTGYQKNMFLRNILGTLEMEQCGVNSLWLKNLIIDRSKEFFSNEVTDKLEKIIQPHYLGTDQDFEDIDEIIPNSILFNHRPNEYTGWQEFLSVMDSLWEKRKDFKVFCTFECSDKKPWLEKRTDMRKKEYLSFIKKMKVGIGFFKNYSAWSMSTTDGLSRGLPYILPNKLCYPEMVGSDYALLYNNESEFMELLEGALNDVDFKKKHRKSLKLISDKLSWSKSLPRWFDGWKFLNEFKPLKNETDSIKDIQSFIKTNKSVTKKEIKEHLNWGVGIKFTSYRNTLRNNKNILLKKNGYEFI